MRPSGLFSRAIRPGAAIRRCFGHTGFRRLDSPAWSRPFQQNRPDGLTTDRPDGIPLRDMKRTDTGLRDALLDAAEAVVARQGVANLTFDAVAAEAGMSKGGLLHHFRSKDRLIEALVTRAARKLARVLDGILRDGARRARADDERVC